MTKSRDMLQASVLFLGVFGVFSIAMVFMLQNVGEGYNGVYHVAVVSASEAKQLWWVWGV